ncbi:MAG: metallophosphoesterase family protein [Proteobacteria bacterium]|nr:metallophosphoesterase family protein [Pseudomonadota bacterium]
MRVAVLADVHANLPALEAVVEDMRSEGVKKIWHLGDAVGYGADPFACLQLLADLGAVLIAGNHEQASCDLAEAEGFNPSALEAARWTHDVLTPAIRARLCDLPLNLSPLPGVFLFHGLPGNTAGYVRTQETAGLVFDHLEDKDPRLRVAFFGHTHKPVVFTRLQGRPVRMFDPRQDLVISPGRRYLVNPGSVGQPRNGDPKAQYLIYDAKAEHILFKRVEYDVAKAQKRIIAAGLPAFLAARLSQGI